MIQDPYHDEETTALARLRQENQSLLEELQRAYAAMEQLFLEARREQEIVYGELRQKIRGLEELFLSTLRSLSASIDAVDHYTQGHSARVSRLTLVIGKHLRLSPQDLMLLEYAALLHDIGKIGVLGGLLKKPGTLDAEERKVMRLHPKIGADIISPIEKLSNVVPMVLHHHEEYDGTGYPDGLCGESIPTGARILHIADALDAMTTDRPYRKALSWSSALAELQHGKRRQFDPEIVDTLLSVPKEEILSTV